MLKRPKKLRNIVLTSFCLFAVTSTFAASNSQEKALMVGVPPTSESQVTFANYLTYPNSKWSFNHAGAPLNVVMVQRGGQINFFKENPLPNLSKKVIHLDKQRKQTFETVFTENETDGIVILKNNEIKYEKYWNYGDRERQHIWFSATKSLVSAALGILVAQGKIDLNASPVKYIPELKNSGFSRTSIQNVLNHRSSIDFKENYTDYNSNFIKYYAPALNMAGMPGARDVQPNKDIIYGVHDFLTKYIKADKHSTPGDMFDYNSVNADVIGWLITRVSGMSLNDFIQKNIWSKLQVEHDAFMVADRAYMPVATAGMNSTARDAARFGSLIMNDGLYNGQQIIPKNWIEKITHISPLDMKRMQENKKYQGETWQAYKNMWWVLDAQQGEFAAVGVYGQVIYINKAKNVVAAYFSSQPKATAANNQMFRDKLTAIRQVASDL